MVVNIQQIRMNHVAKKNTNRGHLIKGRPSIRQPHRSNRTRTITKSMMELPPHFAPILPPDGGVNDVVNLSIFNLTAWILPMAITGRVMGMEWKDLSINLMGLGMLRSAIEMLHNK